MSEFFIYIRSRLVPALFFAAASLIFAVVFMLYGLPAEAVLYAALLSLVPAAVAVIFSFVRYSRRRAVLAEFIADKGLDCDRLPAADDGVFDDYNCIITRLCRELLDERLEHDRARRDMEDYYTVWAHQIKTPISAMGLLIQSGDSGNSEMKAELLKTEQYVDMVLAYLRTGSDHTDFLIASVNLDGIVKQAVRRFSPMFIRGRISADINVEGVSVLSDEKWLSFAVEQVLSNALKYTPAGGSIRIYTEDGPTLVIEDSGIGIAAEDLPRVFEKGFTGYNGRSDKKATGIGLYLVKKITGMLNHSVRITSRAGEGTAVRIYLGSDSTVAE